MSEINFALESSAPLQSILACNQIKKSYKDSLILNDIDLIVWPGKIIVIHGKSGAGKTSLLRILGLMTKLYSGKLWINGENCDPAIRGDSWLSAIRKKYIGFIHRAPNLLAEWSVFGNVFLSANMIMKRKEAYEKARTALAQVDMFHKINERPTNLSDGEAQRVSIARAMVKNPKLVLADEPTCNLDRENADRVMLYLMDLCQKNGTSLIITTHDSKLATFADEVYELCNGSIISNVEISLIQ